MKYQSSNTKSVYNIDFEIDKKKLYTCPECSPNRKKSKDKVLEFYPDTQRAYCFHCNTTFFEYNPYQKKKEYIKPEWKNTTNLSDVAVKWFNSRMIKQETLNKAQIYTSFEWMPQFEKEIECICFPYFRDKELINIKFRGKNKSFKLVSGAELIWFNFNALKQYNEIIICEGEIDALTWMQNGFDNVLSVPNGSNNVNEYLDESIELFEKIEKVYLSTDNDSPGIKLRDELIRRIGSEKCYLINFKQYKDANEYYCNNILEFKNLLKQAIKIPTSGIIEIGKIKDEIEDLYQNGIENGLFTGNPSIDEYLSWEKKRLAIVTGVPMSGKSEFIDYLACTLNKEHGWKVAIFTPENYPLKYHYAKLHEKFSGRKFKKDNDITNFINIYNHIEENFFYIMDEENFTIDYILDRARILVKQKGIDVLILDPYNKMDHQYDSSMTETQYISKFLDKLTKFEKLNDVLLFLVAHPRIMYDDKVPTLYNISGSAHFYNKCDYGFAVHRPINPETGIMGNDVEVHLFKVKFKNLGKQGVIKLRYNYNNGRYEPGNNSIDFWDNSNWLDSTQQMNITDNYELDNFFEQPDDMPF